MLIVGVEMGYWGKIHNLGYMGIEFDKFDSSTPLADTTIVYYIGQYRITDHERNVGK